MSNSSTSCFLLVAIVAIEQRAVDQGRPPQLSLSMVPAHLRGPDWQYSEVLFCLRREKKRLESERTQKDEKCGR